MIYAVCPTWVGVRVFLRYGFGACNSIKPSSDGVIEPLREGSCGRCHIKSLIWILGDISLPSKGVEGWERCVV